MGASTSEDVLKQLQIQDLRDKAFIDYDRIEIDFQWTQNQQETLQSWLQSPRIDDWLYNTQSTNDYSNNLLDDSKILDTYKYTIKYHPFRIEQYINGHLTLIVNEKDTLMFENYQNLYMFDLDPIESYEKLQGDCLKPILDKIQNREYFEWYDPTDYAWLNRVQDNIREEYDLRYPRESFMLGFYINSSHLFGLPERSADFLLQTTESQDPYRIYALDVFPHKEWSIKSLYSGIPFVQGHSENSDVGLMYYNSAETWVDILNSRQSEGNEETGNVNNGGKLVNFITESGVLEFFILGSGSQDIIYTSTKRLSNQLALISGFQSLPPLFSLGYHYSKWEKEVTSFRIMDLNYRFDKNKIPLDVLWLDIGYTDGSKYFEFNPLNFHEPYHSTMKQEIRKSGRKLVVITDPHIKASVDYFVYDKGMDLQDTIDPLSGDYRNIFIQQKSGIPFEGFCWPGESNWIDFFNKKACEFWGNLYNYKVFNGTSDIFHIWIDMNEPSVFNGEEGVMNKTAIHVNSKGTKILHRDVHNAYGLMMLKATYDGLIKRDQGKQRPFILTRSSFFGTQKYGAKWTGDNRAVIQELGVSISQILTLGLSGIHFTGPDVPGFFGEPDQELYIMFYQLAGWYPFYRAHGHLEFIGREPFYQDDITVEVIRQSIYQRYDYTYYMYTLFHESNTQGTPIIRSMWYEFPSNPFTFKLSNQFMLGSSLLIAPKLNRRQDYYNFDAPFEVTFFLPKPHLWYNIYSKKSIIGQDSTHQMFLNNLDQAVFAKGGSIIPIMLHNKSQSLLQAKDSDIRLDIYLDQNQQAKGLLYLDDGESFQYQTHNEKILIEYTFEFQTLSYQILNPEAFYHKTLKIKIQQIHIYGLKKDFTSVSFYEVLELSDDYIDFSQKYKQQSSDDQDSDQQPKIDKYDDLGLLIGSCNIPIDDGFRKIEYLNNNSFEPRTLLQLNDDDVLDQLQ
eukprot:403349187